MPAYVADGDANELDASPVSTEGVKERMIVYFSLSELLVASEVFAYAALSQSKDSESGEGFVGTPRA